MREIKVGESIFGGLVFLSLFRHSDHHVHELHYALIEDNKALVRAMNSEVLEVCNAFMGKQ